MNQIHAANSAYKAELEVLGQTVLAEMAREMYTDQIALPEDLL